MLNFFKRKLHSFVFNRTSTGEFLTKLYDIKHHFKYSFKEKCLNDDKAHLKYYLTKHYHIVEKGLALPEPRLGFGQPKILDIINKTKEYESIHNADEMVSSIRKTLLDYMNFNNSKGYQFSDEFKSIVTDFLAQGSVEGLGGLKYISKESASTLNLQGFRDFAQSRVSVRDFSDEIIADGLLYEAVDIAKSAPSVCNRQGWKVHCYNEKPKIKEVLSYQNGNAGFTDVVDKLIIVTADAKAFTKYESNQIFIDGGLFSMNLLLAIHAAGLGACCLNTCYPYFTEKKVKEISGIPDSERLIMMIAVGCLKEDYSAAYSCRNPTNEIFVSH